MLKNLPYPPLSLSCLAGLLALASNGAQAQHADAVAEDSKNLPVIRAVAARELYAPGVASAAKLDVPLRDIPQTINVVPAQVIKDQAARSMNDVLKTVPGVGLSNGDGQRDQVTIRGFTAIADQFLDGVRDDALYFRDLSNIEQIEVVKGPASVLYGRGSSGGLINRVTKKPRFVANYEVGAMFGSFDLKRVEIDANQPFADNKLAFRLTGAVERSGSFREQGFLERESVAPSLLWRATPATTVLAQFEHNRDFRPTDFGMPSYQGKPVNLPVRTYFGSSDARADDYTRASTDYATVTIDHEFSSSLAFHNVSRFYSYALDRNNTTVEAVLLTGPVPIAQMRRGNVRRDEKGWFNQAELKHKFSSGNLEHQALYGVELGEQSKDQFFSTKSRVFTTPLLAPVLQRPPFFVATPSTDGLGRFKVAAVYAQDLLSLGEHWKLLAGLRFDRFEQTYDNQLPGGTALKRTDNFLSPRLGLVWQPDGVQSYYASATQSFQPSGESFGLAANNAELKPEQTVNYEIGAKYEMLAGKLSSSVAIFSLTRSDIKTTDPSNPAKLVLTGEQRSNGAEFTLAGDLGGGWNVYAGYAFLDAKITASTAKVAYPYLTLPATAAVSLQGNAPSLTPRHSGNVWLSKLLGGGFSVAGGVNARGNMFASPSNAVALGRAITLDLALFYRIPHWELALNLKNAADQHYFASAHGGNDNLNTPGAPRAFEASARYRF